MPASPLIAALSGAGLAGATGHRAFIPAFLLGVAHHLSAAAAAAGQDPFFQLGQNYEWLANPVVMLVLGGMTVLEYLAEANPDMPELAEWAMKLPKLVGGFVVVAATVGSTSDSMTLMVASGVLGSGTAMTVDTIRAGVKHAVEDSLADATGGGSTKAMALAETGWSLGLTILAIVIPVLVIAAAIVWFLIWRSRKRLADTARVPCPHCNEPRHKQATVCPHCRRDIPVEAV